MAKTRDEAWDLLNEYTQSESLIKHALCVEASMRAYARHFGEDEEKWGITGLLHDFDYEKYPEYDTEAKSGHPYEGVKILKEQGYDQDMLDAILGHAEYTGTPRETMIAKALFAVDELSGFVMAVAYVRPEKLDGMKPKSVKKKLKDKAFAAAVSRDDISQGVEELGVDTDEHIARVIDALSGISTQLGF